MEETTCEHNWRFKGLVYREGSAVAGSSAKTRLYGDAFYCTKCLEQAVVNWREIGNSYEKPLPGAMPG